MPRLDPAPAAARPPASAHLRGVAGPAKAA